MAILTRQECEKPTKKNKDTCEIFKEILDYDGTKFYLSPDKRKIVTGNTVDRGRNICVARAGDYAEKERNCDVLKIKNIHYPNYKKISLFDEMSYHGARSQGESKINRYGKSNYNLQFTKLTPKIKDVEFDVPVKTHNKRSFLKPIKKVDLNQEDYVVIDWEPSDGGTSLQVNQKRTSPTGEEKAVFKSKKFPLSERNRAIKLFKERVKTLS